MIDQYWFQKKWGKLDEVPMDDVYKRLSELEIKVRIFEEKYSEIFETMKKLEDENLSLTNELYRLENSLDARIDILATETYNLDKFSLDK